MLKKIFSIFCFVAILSLMACSNSSSSDKTVDSDYPKKSIEVIVPFAAGGSTDVAARTIASVAEKHLPNNQSLVISNKEGGGGSVGLNELKNSKPDGYTIGLASAGSISYQPLYDSVSYTVDDFKSISLINKVPQFFVVRSDSQWENFDEWIEYAKKNPNDFKYATAGNGIPSHVAMEALKIEADIDVKNVPYEGAEPAVTALLGGHVDGAVVQPTDVKSYIESGDLTLLANFGETDMDGFEDAPFLTDKEYEVAVDVFAGFLGPIDLPDEIVEILDEAFAKALEDDELIEKFEDLGIIPIHEGPEEFKEFYTNTYEESKEVVEEAKLLD